MSNTFTLGLLALGIGLAVGAFGLIWRIRQVLQEAASSKLASPIEAISASKPHSLLNWFERGEWRTWRPNWPAPSRPMAQSAVEPAPGVITNAPRIETEAELVNTPDSALNAIEVRGVESSATPVKIHLEVPPGVAVRVTVETKTAGEAAFGKPRIIVAGEALELSSTSTTTRRPTALLPEINWVGWLTPLQPLWQRITRVVSPEMVLMLGALAIYAFTRLYALPEFPIYFFTDEAVHTVQAAELLRNGLRDPLTDTFLPTFLANENFDLGFSVYAQLIPYWIFGYSQTVTRAVSALFTVLGALAVGLTLRRVFNLNYGWVGILLLAITPAWFLHSRTAFETVMMTALYACFLYAYLRYRTGSPRWLYAALVAGALAFYSYTPGQLVIVLTGLFLLISDWRYHWRAENRVTVFWSIGLLLVLAAPYIRFQIELPDAGYDELRKRGAAWLVPGLTFSQRAFILLGEYIQGLNPLYWYFANDKDLVRHRLGSLSHLGWWALPLMAVGLWQVLKNIRRGEYRALLLALLAAPTGAALAQISITRALPFIVPATLIASLGLCYLLERLESFNFRRAWVTAGSLLVLGGFSVWMLTDALTNGPTWFTNYGMFGMQYGARQVFGEAVPKYLAANPNTRIYLSPNWANGTNMLARFFLPKVDNSRMRLESFAYFRERPKFEELTPEATLVLMPDEYTTALNDPKFSDIQVREVVPYPDGTPGFYFVSMRYSDQAAVIFEAEAEERRRPVASNVQINGETVTVLHSRLDFGEPKSWFDNDSVTLARGEEANPLQIEVQFPTPRPITKLALTTGTMANFVVQVAVFGTTEEDTASYSQRFSNLPPDPTVEVDLQGAPAAVTRVIILITDENAVDPVHIHLRDVIFNP